MDLTIVCPTIYPKKWHVMLETIPESIRNYSYEVIFIGPYEPTFELPNNCRFIKNLAHPTRCVQEAALSANGKLFTWVSDDCKYFPDGLYEAITFYDSKQCDENDEVIIRYFEGMNHSGDYTGYPLDGKHFSVWHAHHHDSLKLPFIPVHYKVAPIGMLALATFKKFGGFDCRFEHINFSCLDLSVRLQNEGHGVYLSPTNVISCDHEIDSPKRNPIIQAHIQNDSPLFTKLHSEPRQNILDFDNYKLADEIWARRR